MPEELSDRVMRLEEGAGRAWAAIETLAHRQTALHDSLATLVDAQIKTEERFRETDARLEKLARETDARFRETDGRFRETDVRIEKLVSAIGDFLRNGRTQP